jgi:hypothetical protein
VVVFIVESYGREYIGAFNKMLIYLINKVALFIDSLAQHSMILPMLMLMGQSIHGMSSVPSRDLI